MNINALKTAVFLCLTVLSCALPVSASNVFDHVRSVVMKSAKAPLLPRTDFNRQQELGQVLLSPDGKKLAYLLKKNRHVQLWRYDIASQSHEKLLSVKSVSEMHWMADSQHLLYLNGDSLYSISMGVKSLPEKVYELDGMNIGFVRPDPDIAEAFWITRYFPETKRHALVIAKSDGTEQVVFESEVPLSGFLSKDGKVQVIEQWVDKQIRISRVDNDKTTLLMTCRELASCHSHYWQETTQTLLVSAYFEQDILSLFEVSAETGERKLVHQEPGGKFDIEQVGLTDRGTPNWISYQTGYLEQYGLTESSKNVLIKIKEKTQSKLTWLSASEDANTWLVVDADPGRSTEHFYIYQTEKDRWQSPFTELVSPALDDRWLAPRMPFWYTASDGMELQGYLTLPLGYDPQTVPLIALPHGGPWKRTHGGFSNYAQFLANRGYAVFEPNFRGSTGLGYNYVTSANKDFGDGRVQLDIIEGLDFLLKHGIGDPDKQAISGHSFGGFSALSALAFSPNRFKVAFAGAAPANLANTMLRYVKQLPFEQNYRVQLTLKELMVDTSDSNDIARLYNQSPDRHWRNISQPLVMWAGERDDRVAIEDIRDIALRLQSTEKNVTLLADPIEGHSPTSAIAREAYYFLVEHTLATFVQGRVERSVNPKLRRYLDKYVLIDSAGLVATLEHNANTNSESSR